MDQVAAAQNKDAFAALVAAHRRELLAYCYRMLGSAEDAEDALQETLTAAWKGLDGFEGRSSLRTWLYRIACRCCLRLAQRRPKRLLSWDLAAARSPGDDLGSPVPGAAWVGPLLDECPEDRRLREEDPGEGPESALVRREGVELAYVAALQHLTARQRAVLVLRDVLSFSGAEVAELLDASPQAVDSALRRARKAMAARPYAGGGHGALGERDREAVERFAAAFERADVPALARLLAEDVRFTMPPLPAWFAGREDAARFFAERVFATAWRTSRLRCNGQPALACYEEEADGRFRLGVLMVLGVREGSVEWLAAFVDPDQLRRLGLPAHR